MRKIIPAVILTAMLPSAVLANNSIEYANREVGIAEGWHSLSYREYDPQAGINPLDTENGGQPAVRLRFGIQGRIGHSHDWYAHLNFDYSQGTTHYNGYLQDLSTGDITPWYSITHDITSDVALRLGKGIVFGSANRFQLTPQLVYEYHSWRRNSGDVGIGGYLETYQHQGAGVGLLEQLAVGKLVIGLQETGERTLEARMQSNDITQQFKLGSRFADAEELSFDYCIHGAQHVTLTLVRDHFGYGRSQLVPYGSDVVYEPNSSSTEKSVYVGYALDY